MKTDRFESPSKLRVLILTSAKAGSGAGRDEIPILQQSLDAESVHCEVISSIELMRERLGDREQFCQTVVIAAGGDGTLSLAASLIIASEQGDPSSSENVNSSAPSTSMGEQDTSILLLPMPMGTENLVSQQFSLSRSADAVLATLRFGQVSKIDAGMANDRIFLIMATAGFDAAVVKRLHETRQGHIRRISYLPPVAHSMFRYRFPPLKVRLDDGREFSCGWAMAFNLPQYGGGLRIEPEADPSDGKFDVVLFQRRSIWSGLGYVLKIFQGRHFRDASVVRLRSREVLIEAGCEVPFQIDGDFEGHLPLRLRMLDRAVSLLLPDPQGVAGVGDG